MKEKSPLARIRSERVGRVVTAVIFSLPLWADLVAKGLGFELFYLADPKLQAVWGTLVQLFGGWPLYSDAFRQFRAGGSGRAIGMSLLSTLLYAIGLYTALVNPGTGAPFLASSGLILLSYLLDYLQSRTER